MIMAIVCSAVVITLPVGVFMTTTPFGGRRNIHIVQTDAGPADDLNLTAASRRSSVTLVALRITKASY